ncbi:MAG TPA: YicC/YloC family endoribonuclease [Gemmatimonadales bacterium]|nr:YicC/YloC family endoribonuclease [Gemmatimonadales bacterium]
MPRSMTGFGTADVSVAGGLLQVELRSVNHRHLNLHFKLPADLQRLESDLRDRIRDRVERGHVTVAARWLAEPVREGAARLDLGRAREYARLATELKSALALPGEVDLAWVARLPGVLQDGDTGRADVAAGEVLTALDAALAAMVSTRTIEGAALGAELERQVDVIERELAQVEQRAPARLAGERDRLQRAVAELLNGARLDEARLAQEIALHADRLDFREEIVRLRTHLAAARAALAATAACGRRLGFLGQEMLREINTIGSKANDAAIAHAVISMKEAVERFREQVENLE